MITMLKIEVRRCLARRLVRWLVALAVLACVVMSVVLRLQAPPPGDPDELRLVSLWTVGGDSFLGVATFFLLVGAVVAGASMIGAEWRAGTFVTLLTWEPARVRVAAAKLIACGVVAATIALALQAIFCAAFLPTALGPGTTAGVDAAWFRGLVGAMVRSSSLIGLAAVLMASVAMVGRNTAAALGVAFGYLIILENLLRAWKPWMSRFLLGENGAIFATGADLHTEGFTRSPLAAGLTLTGYVGAIGLVAVASFWRRDLASAS
ncbi:MAG: hypothetical protein ACT4OV_09925 [Microthrixaceae bacterium]